MKDAYYSSTFNLFSLMAVAFWSMTLLRHIVYWLNHASFPPLYTATVVGGTFGLALIAFVAARYWKIRVGKNGLTGPNLWGRFTTIAWHDIGDIAGRGFLIWRFIVIRSTGNAAIWILLPLDRPEDFEHALRTRAPDH